MKKNTIQLLLSSYAQSSLNQEKNLRNYQFYYDIFSEMTEGGVRSCIFQLVQKGFLKRLVLNGQSFFSITDAGISKLGLLVPGLKIKERKKGDTRGWLLILIEAPKQDPHFLKLHQSLKKNVFHQFIRGVYYYPFATISESLIELLLTRYASSISLVEVQKFSLVQPDSEKNLLSFKKKLNQSSSGVSKQVSLLIDPKNRNNKSIYQSKMVVKQMFSFACEVFYSTDVSFLDEKTIRDEFYQMLSRWNTLIQLVYFSQ